VLRDDFEMQVEECEEDYSLTLNHLQLIKKLMQQLTN
jgi:hypothetical protein